MEFGAGKVGQSKSMVSASFPTELSNTAEVLRGVVYPVYPERSVSIGGSVSGAKYEVPKFEVEVWFQCSIFVICFAV
jgi:hypothetical protein